MSWRAGPWRNAVAASAGRTHRGAVDALLAVPAPEPLHGPFSVWAGLGAGRHGPLTTPPIVPTDLAPMVRSDSSPGPAASSLAGSPNDDGWESTGRLGTRRL